MRENAFLSSIPHAPVKVPRIPLNGLRAHSRGHTSHLVLMLMHPEDELLRSHVVLGQNTLRPDAEGLVPEALNINPYSPTLNPNPFPPSTVIHQP